MTGIHERMKLSGTWAAILLFLWPAAAAMAQEPPSFALAPESSELTFEAIQNNAPVKGKFGRFDAEIKFDPAHPETGKVKITVDLSSVTADYGEMADALKGPDWFDVAKFPTATFEASGFKILETYRARDAEGKIEYQGVGMLTMRGITKKEMIIFSLDRYDEKGAVAKGHVVMLKRNDFGVGQGEWASTSSVKDDVNVYFTVTANRK